MRRAVIATLLLPVAVTACAVTGGTGPADQAPAPPGRSVAPTGGATGGPPPLPDPSPPEPPSLTPTTPLPGSRDRAARWTLAGRSGDGRMLLLDVTVGGPPCDAVTGIDVEESTGVVTITVYAGATAAATSCSRGIPAVVGTVRVPVRLAAPLAERTLADGGRG
jgi:hypothetical protein